MFKQLSPVLHQNMLLSLMLKPKTLEVNINMVVKDKIVR